MAKVTLNDLSRALGLNEKAPKKDFHYYGTIVSSNPEDRTYEVSINRDENVTVEAARLVGAAIGDTVMVTVMANGYATVTGRLGGDLDSTNAQRAADAAADTASTAQGVANSALSNAQQANQTANAAKTLAENAEAEAGRAHTAAEQAASDASSAATSAQNAEASASSASTAATNAESSASRAATSASNAESSASRASTAAQNAEADASSAATSASNAESSASSAATSASNAESDASRAATSASNAESSASRASTAAMNAESDAASAAESAQNAAADAATAKSQASAATTAANEAKTQAGEAKTAADEAKTDANAAKRDAAAANAAANGAVTSLAITQGVVDQLGQDMDDMQTHVAMMDAVGDIPAGLHVVPASGGYFMVIANDGVYVYDNESVLVAKYGHDISFDSNREHKIGNNSNYIRYYDANNDGVADSIEIVANNIRLGSYSVADKIAEAKKAGTDASDALSTYKTSNDARVKAVEDGLSSTDEDLANYITSQADVIEDLQNQIDGAIDTWYYSGDPTLSNQPAVAWTTDETKENHLRDLYFNTQNGHSFRFAKEGNTYKWIQIEDADAIKALADAAAAQGTANVKKRVFVTTPYVPYDVGDLWVAGSKGDIKKCKTSKTSSQSYAAADWELASKYTDDTYAKNVESDLHTNYYVKSDFSVAPDKIASTISATETTVKTYADSKASTAESNAKTYADNNFDGKGSAASALSDAKDYADDNFDSKGSASAAQAAAISAAAADATSKANAAESNAKADTTNKLKSYCTKTQTDSAITQKADNILSTVSTTYQTKADMDDYSTTAEMNSAIDQKADSITSTVSQTYATKTQAQGYADTAESNAKNDTANKLKSYYTKTQTDSAITQKADNILSTVSTTYQTKADMDDYSTTAEMNSAIDQKADSITSTVSQTYATKTQAQGYADTAESNAKTAAATDATNKANAAKADAISAASTDATSKANAAKADAISAASTDATNKANAAKQAAIDDAASKYYNKTETYTKSEIEQKAGEISLSVAQEEVEKVISVKESSGNIVHVEDASEYPALSLKVHIIPIQNLNGYSKPWVGGAGKNKLNPVNPTLQNVTFENGVATEVTADTRSTVSFILQGYNNGSFVKKIGTNVATGVMAFTKDDTFNQVFFGHSGAKADAKIGFNVSNLPNGDYKWCFTPITTDAHPFSWKDMMIVESSVTDYSYEPYENICPISGWDSIRVTKANESPLKPSEARTETLNGITFESDGNGNYHIYGTASATNEAWSTVFETEEFTIPPSGEWGVFFNNTAANSNVVVIFSAPNASGIDSWGMYEARRSHNAYVAMANKQCGGLRFRVTKGATVDMWISPLFLKLAGMSTTLVNLGRTVYGSTLDVVSGVLTVDRATVTLDGTEAWVKDTDATSPDGIVCFRAYLQNDNIKKPEGTASTIDYIGRMFSNTMPTLKNGYTNQYPMADTVMGVTGYSGASNNYLYIVTNKSASNVQSVAELKSWLAENPTTVVYELATPQTYQLAPTEVNMLLGENNVWADAGDVDLKYASMNSDMHDLMSKSNADLKITAEGISSEVSKKVGNDEVISKINQSAESVKIQASKVEIDGTATFNAIKSKADAAYDAKGAAAAKKSIHTLDSNYSQTYAKLLAWSKEGEAGGWAVSSTAGVAVGDTVRIKCSVSDMNNAAVYVLGTVTSLSSATVLQMTSHGLDTTIIDGGNILTNSITANQIKGNTLTLGQIATDVQKRILDKSVDTRNDNQPPSWYITNYPMQTIREFKYRSVIGVENSSGYCDLTTKVPWDDRSGGYPSQTAEFAGKQFWRQGKSDTEWTEWIDASATATDYLTFTEADGLTVGKTGKKERVNIKSSGMNVYDSSDASVAEFGSTARIGKDKLSRFVINSSSLEAYNGSNQKYFDVSANGITFGTNNTVAKTSDIPTNVSQLTNDSNYQNATQVATKADAAAWSVELETTSIDLLNNLATIKATVYKYGVKQTDGFTRAWYKDGSVISDQDGESIVDVSADALYTCVIT